LREKEEAEAETKRQKTYEETQQGVQNYLAGLEQVEETNTQVLKERLAAQQQRKEEDVAQEITLDRINLVLDNFGLRAAGVEPEVRKLVESKIDEGVVDRTVTRELGIQGLEGRTYRGEQATEVLPNIAAAIDKLIKSMGKIGSAGKAGIKEETVELQEAYSTIKTLKRELHEINLLNAKLLYTNKIFKAKNLTDPQKVKVLENFDKATTVNEVKLVFETLTENLNNNKTTVNESKMRGFASKTIAPVVNKKQPIIESNDAFARMQRLAGLR
jgi:hypothetical protein